MGTVEQHSAEFGPVAPVERIEQRVERADQGLGSIGSGMRVQHRRVEHLQGCRLGSAPVGERAPRADPHWAAGIEAHSGGYRPVVGATVGGLAGCYCSRTEAGARLVGNEDFGSAKKLHQVGLGCTWQAAAAAAGGWVSVVRYTGECTAVVAAAVGIFVPVRKE